MGRIGRRDFLGELGACGLAPQLLGATGPDVVIAPLREALVFSGGGARGAYEAGIVGALAAQAGLRDGSPLPPYELVCGTSIGALNGWFVATGQYSRLRELWYGISAEHLLRPKPEYAALQDQQSGVVNRAASAVRLIGLAKNESGLLQSEPVYEWIARNIDPTTPLLMPLAWAVTNLARQQPEYFYVHPKDDGPGASESFVRAFQASLGTQTVVREATPELLHAALFASTALPIVFDPVAMPGPDGQTTYYCDGGVASNSPVGIAHALSRAADVVLIEPRLEPETDYQDAIEIAFSVFGTMQRKILELEMRSAVLQTALRYIRPQKVLPLTVIGFDDERGIGQAYRLGWEDLARGFSAYDWQTFAV
jgi:predicted acylesterase/phospholipase RssA